MSGEYWHGLKVRFTPSWTWYFELAAPLLVAVVTATLLRFVFIPTPHCCLSWIAFVPLLLLVARYRPSAAFILGWISSLIFNYSFASWVFEIPGFLISHGVLLGAYLGLFFATWCSVVAYAWHKRGTFLFLVPATWVILDYLRAHAGPLALSWATPAYWLHENPSVLHLASYAGEYGVTFLVILVNSAIAVAIMERRFGALVMAAIFIAAPIVIGTATLMQPESPAQSVRVAVVQPAFSIEELKSFSGDQKLNVLGPLTMKAAEERPDVIIWPEAVVHDWRRDAGLLLRLGSIAKNAGAPVVLGMSESGKSVQYGGDDRSRRVNSDSTFRNTAVLFSESGLLSDSYSKNILVPFSEFTPFEDLFDWPEWIPEPELPMTPGTGQTPFRLAEEIIATPIICWENLFADYVRKAVTKETSLVLHLVNDNWAGRTWASFQHNAASVLRAVENRIPVVTASNTGPSQLVDGYGRIVANLPELFERGVIVTDIQTQPTRSFYHRYGDWFVMLCGLMVVISVLVVSSRPQVSG